MTKRARKVDGPSPQYPLLVFSLISFILWMMMIFYVDPMIVKDVGINNSYFPFYLLLLMWVMTLLVGVGLGKLRAAVWSTLLVFFFVLRVMGLGHILNALLLISLLVTYEYLRVVSNK